MRRTLFSLILVTATLMAFSVTGMAQNCNRRGRTINERQRSEQFRIGRGIRSGELTRWEAARLGREQRSIRYEERLYRADGQFTGAERREIRDELNDANRHIYRSTHNRRDRY